MITQTNVKTRISRLLDRSLARTTSTRTLRNTGMAFAGLILAIGTLSPAAESARKVYKVEGDVQPPRVIVHISPDYTEDARLNKVQGTVALSIVVGTDGLAHDITIVRTLDPGLDRNAAEIMQQWRFAPGTLRGEPVDVQAVVEINYKLQ